MKRTILDLTGKIDSSRVEAISLISDVARSRKVSFFLIGAAARDFILMHGYNIASPRATLDIDLGIRVPDWDQFMKLRQDLMNSGEFTETKEIHRLKYHDALRIDLIPFGPIADSRGSFKWPPDHEVEMSIVGFEEAHAHAVKVILRSNPLLQISVASVAGLAIMKILSWKDGSPGREKDAGDLAFILKSYTYTEDGNIERILNEESDLLEEDDYDYILAGARVLGRDMAVILDPSTKKIVLDILSEEIDAKDRSRLIGDIIKSGILMSENFTYIHTLLNDLKKGILDR